LVMVIQPPFVKKHTAKIFHRRGRGENPELQNIIKFSNLPPLRPLEFHLY
jgi:hypothetical protein